MTIAMANCVLPEDIMLCILTRLPVKSILRFTSVCKPWRDLFATLEFKKLHQGQFSSDPKNQSFIVHSFSKYCSEPENRFSIFNIESGENRPTILDHPFAHTQTIELDTVGCCNGLVCISVGQEIVLWNPGMKLFKTVPLKDDCEPFEMVSLGFGYDAVGGDFKVVRIVGEKSIVNRKGVNVTSVEMYSVNSDSWIAIDVGFQFSGFRAKNDLIVNGNPYWVARVDGNEVLVCFGVMELVFMIVPVPTLYWNGLDEVAETEIDVDMVNWNGLDAEAVTETETEVDLVDWNGALGAILYIINHEMVDNLDGPECTIQNERVESLCVWVFEDGEQKWRKNHTFGPIEVSVDRVLHCSNNGKVLGSLSSGTLFVLDLETGCVKELFDGACQADSFEVYRYIESLAYINGMEKVVVENEREDLDD